MNWSNLWSVISVLLWAWLLWYSAVKHAEYRKRILAGDMWVKGLEPGWFNNYPQDLSDPQWKTLRKFIVPLTVGMLGHVGVSAIIRRMGTSFRIWLYVLSNFAFVYFLHGRGTVWVISTALCNYAIGRMFRGSRLNPAFTWLLCIIVNCSSDWYRGFERVYFQNLLGGWASFIDSYDGVYAWQTQFNLSMLRYISFNHEFYWAVNRQSSGESDRGRAMEARGASEAQREKGDDEKGKKSAEDPDPQVGVEVFTLVNFFAYVFYIPLHIAGPISPFNNWVFQVLNPPVKPVMTNTWWFLGYLRVAASTISLEILLHLWYYVSINNNRTWSFSYISFGTAMPGWEVAWGGLFTLQFMYLKFLVIWRFFRLWSRADGIEVPENMGRCVNNNFSFSGFWRQWHGSLNKWIIKYLYIPLGGTSTQWWNMWVVFTFIGLWHDLMWRWLAWAWLNIIFFSIELGVRYLTKAPAFKPLKEKDTLWGFMAGLAGSINIHLLVLANLAIMHGFDGSRQFLMSIFTEGRGMSGSMSVLPLSVIFFWFNTMSMTNIRTKELISMGGKRF